MTDIAIIGAGHVGLTLLADLQLTKPLHGRTATLLTFDRTGVLDRRTRDWTRLTMENLVTGDVEQVALDPAQFGSLWSEQGHEALQRAGSIFVTVPDIPDLRLDLLDHLERTVDLAGKLIVYVRGGQGGQPVLAKWIRDTPRVRDTSVVLVEDAFYGTRVLGDRIQFKRKISVNVSVYSPDPDAALAALRAMFPLGSQINRPSWPDMAVTDGIELQFNPLGYIIHVGVALDPANLAKTREGIRYTHYIDGISPELAARLDLLDQERVMLAEAMGARAQTFPEIIQRQYGLPPQPTFHAMMQSCRPIYRSLSNGSIEELRTSRVLLEDMPAFHTIRWLADACGIDMPHTRAYFVDVLDRLREIGADSPGYTAYLPYLDKIDGGTAELKELLNHPHRTKTEV
ncbi:NAD/NADP octopine/nopaline dehydrogenase family protein [Streptomyces sp. NBC_00847]|uniref:NAD/NADP octopine/nopaline dehydrogenase family protein n=1 Tax=unclassified Streptomyces TaxID=2593676 RepID=UPI00224F7BD5|nr:NAD/NADP octopine/nopaline dehydrogenase family protein [Streptomyces sp. NBC_00847]MCX4879079.1 NAD/NADP octopine/nopaline dehydrogenase family protein [Streptomyces sp. NBC_00847]